MMRNEAVRMQRAGYFVSSGLYGAMLVMVGVVSGRADAGLPAPIPAPVDRPFGGDVSLDVDASDVGRRVVHVHETIRGLGSEAILLYPKWLPGTHAPEGPIDRIGGLKFSVNGKPVSWQRDTVEIYAFHLHLPARAATVDVQFDYLAPVTSRVGDPQLMRDLMMLEWNDLVLYPAGYYARQIPVTAQLTVPAGWSMATALERSAGEGAHASFERASLEKLVDSPVYAGKHFKRFELDAATHVNLDVFADRDDQLQASDSAIRAHCALVTQAYKVFRSRHYQHYDFLFALTDQTPYSGLEHHQSSEDSSDPDYFLDWDGTPAGRDLLAHEFTHSWNGKFRRPADLWTPNYEVPMQNSLLWVYEGQTQYWGFVLTARSGLWNREQALDAWAEVAAYHATLPGRQWRPLQDTTNDEIINPRRPMSWDTWQRFEDYYDEGALLWLEVDTLIRERSAGKRSLDDFAARFLGVNDGSSTTLTYTFQDLVRVLNEVEPYDWATYLRTRADTVNRPAPLDGFARGGYRLVFTDRQSDYQKAAEAQHKHVSLRYSMGLEVDEKDSEGIVTSVAWGSPAYQAAITAGMRILAINGETFSADLLRRTVAAARTTSTPTVFILKSDDRYVIADVDYHGGHRYPHLERDPSAPARLDEILAPRN